MKRKTILVCFGTRPEALKFVPLIKELKGHREFKTVVCLTGQHRQMLDQVVSFFNIPIDIDLRLMTENQSLEHLTAMVLTKMPEVLKKVKPDLVIVQGDTSTAAMVALASYYAKIPVAHLEAGLRTGNKYQPFPEEINRQIIARIADVHFAPTKMAADNLLREHVERNRVFNVGNTIVDTIRIAQKLVKKNIRFLTESILAGKLFL